MHADDRDRVEEAFATRHSRDRVPIHFHHDRALVGPDEAYQHCWGELAPHDVVLIHTDMSPLPADRDGRWYRDLCAWAVRLPEAGAVACNLLYPSTPASPQGIVQCAGGILNGVDIGYVGADKATIYSPELATLREVQWVTFGGVFLRRAALDACGPLDPGYRWTYVRDVDHCLEMWRRGWRMYQCPVVLLHVESQSTRPFLEQSRFIAAVRHNERYFRAKWSRYLGASGTLEFPRASEVDPPQMHPSP